MNQRRQELDAQEQLLKDAAWCMRHHADAALDGTHAVPDIPEIWALALISLAGMLESEAQTLNLRTRPFALAAARSFIHGSGAIL